MATATDSITNLAGINKISADKAAPIIARAKTFSSLEAGRRCYALDHLGSELTPEENVEYCALMSKPTKFYVER